LGSLSNEAGRREYSPRVKGDYRERSRDLPIHPQWSQSKYSLAHLSRLHEVYDVPNQRRFLHLFLPPPLPLAKRRLETANFTRTTSSPSPSHRTVIGLFLARKIGPFSSGIFRTVRRSSCSKVIRTVSSPLIWRGAGYIWRVDPVIVWREFGNTNRLNSFVCRTYYRV